MPLFPREIEIIGECLSAAAHGPFFPDGEFSAVFGISLEEVARVAGEWPVVIENSEIADIAVNNSFANLMGYPIKPDKMACWEEVISVPREELKPIFKTWRESIE